jgi:hypothetical protein
MTAQDIRRVMGGRGQMPVDARASVTVASSAVLAGPVESAPVVADARRRRSAGMRTGVTCRQAGRY